MLCLELKGTLASSGWEQQSLAQWKPLWHLGHLVFGLACGQFLCKWLGLPQPQHVLSVGVARTFSVCLPVRSALREAVRAAMGPLLGSRSLVVITYL